MMIYFIEAWQNLSATKLRTLLAMLGILAGAASVVAMVSSGQLATQQALAQFKSLGTDMLAVAIYEQDTGQPAENNAITPSTVLNLPQKIPAIHIIAPYILLYAETAYADTVLSANTIGATHSLAQAIKIKMLKGRFISDLDGYSPYCVIGKQLYEQIKAPFSDLIGQQIKLGKLYFTIIGVADTWQENNFFNQDINNAVIVPIKAVNLLTKDAKIKNIAMRLQDNTTIPQVEKAISHYLTSNSSSKKLFFHSAQEIIASMTGQHKIFTWLLGLIGSISLLVGGIGIMNIMLVAVLERRREIGIRLALGAKRRDIHRMFLSEAITLSVAGGAMGIVLGVFISFIIAQFARWQFTICSLPIFAGFTVSVLTGGFFGFYPALQAAKLDPIEALRTE